MVDDYCYDCYVERGYAERNGEVYED
jgi:hypothetical protein